MKELLASGKVGQIELNENKRIRQEITKRWDSLGMTDGLKGVIKENISMLYENEAKQLLKEASSSENSGSFETVVFPIIRRIFSKLLANDIVSVQAMNLPVGKLFFMLPQTSEREWEFLNEEGKVQNGSVGRHKGLMGYNREDRNNNGSTSGNRYNRFYLPDEVVNNMVFEYSEDGGETWTEITSADTFTYNKVKSDGTIESATGIVDNYDSALQYLKSQGKEDAIIRQVKPAVTKYHRRTLYDLFYNDFLYDNSKGKIRIRVAEGDNLEPVVMEDFAPVAIDDKHEVKVYTDGTVRNLMLKVKGFSNYKKGKLIGPDGNEMDTEAFLASLKVYVNSDELAEGDYACFDKFEGVPFRVVSQRYGNAIVEEGDFLLIDLDLSKPVKKQGASIDGYMGIDPEKVKDADAIKKLFAIAWSQYDSLELETEIGEVSFTLSSVTVSVEERKLRATWSPELAQDVSAFHNIDAEAELTALLSEQIAAEIDREILRDLRKAAPWQSRWDVNGWRRMAGFSTNYTQKDWNQELITKINQISAQIHKSTLRGGANFIVVSSEISAVFDNLEYFHVSDASAESDQYNMGIERIGALQNRYQVYRDPYSPAWSIIIGHKGKSLLDTGYIYAPYIPMQLTPTIYNPENFAPVKGIMTRYAKKVVNNRFYGAVKVDGLVQWDPQEIR